MQAIITNEYRILIECAQFYSWYPKLHQNKQFTFALGNILVYRVQVNTIMSKFLTI